MWEWKKRKSLYPYLYPYGDFFCPITTPHYRSSKRDGLQYAVSGDAPLALGDGENFTIFSTLEDEQGSSPFEQMEKEDFLVYCRCLLRESLESLPCLDGEIIRLKYLESWTHSRLAEHFHLSASRIGQLAERGLERLAQGVYQQKLKEALETFGEFEAMQATAKYSGASNFLRTRSSSVEAKVLLGA